MWGWVDWLTVNFVWYAEQVFWFTLGFITAAIVVTVIRSVNEKRKYRVRVN